jgi:2-polyprenyl-3-methyl-5-hydroxy-6-metoxy-1,4-benzoquinol methylase
MNSNDLYEHKNEAYFSFVRTDIGPLLPEKCGNVIELGCGGGSTLAWLKSTGIASHTTGMELCAEPAAQARKRVDRVIEGDLDVALSQLDSESYDMVLCLDVLEHLVDPWNTVQRLFGLLRPGGSILISVPNIRHYSVLLPLLLNGTWRYQDAGIMDRSHLRFFSRDSAREMLTQGGFVINGGIDTGTKPLRRREIWKSLIARTMWRDLCVFQFLLRAEKPMRLGGAGGIG